MAATGLAQEEAPRDPTKPSPKLKALLMESGSAIPELAVKGMVLSAARQQPVVLFEVAGAARVLARPGVPFSVVSDGGTRRLLIKRIDETGIEVESLDSKESLNIGTVSLPPGRRSGLPSEVEYAEFRDLELLEALRMLGEQTGQNFAASVEANKVIVNTMLRDVPATSIVEEICKGNGLWFRRDPVSGITRIMTQAEYQKDSTAYREEESIVFTLKYPNVNDVALAIADLYGRRVRFAMGGSQSDRDMRRDLESRFDRFDVLNERTQTASGVNGVGTGGTVENRSRSGVASRSDQQVSEGDSARLGALDGVGSITAASGDPTGAGALDGQPIYVTASRRNSQIAVRTADNAALRSIEDLVARMDVPTPLVLLEVKVARIELGKDFRSAFDYQFNDGTLGASFSRDNLSSVINPGDLTFVAVNRHFQARMQLFEQKNRIKTLSTPTLLTANNEVSRIFLGEERPIVTGISSQVILTDNNVATTPNTTTVRRNVGTTLLITPNINSDRTVTLRLVQDNSFLSPNGASIPIVTSTRGVQNVPVDVIGSRTVSGTFVAKDGMAIAIGGLIEDDDIERRGQVPGAGDIPLLGTLFRRTERAKNRRELVIIIRPYVMSTPADGERISRDMLDRLAPDAVERMVDEGFLPNLPPPPVAKAIRRPAPTAAATKKVPTKKFVPPQKNGLNK
jgi:general secretion pathway protein D